MPDPVAAVLTAYLSPDQRFTTMAEFSAALSWLLTAPAPKAPPSQVPASQTVPGAGESAPAASAPAPSPTASSALAPSVTASSAPTASAALGGWPSAFSGPSPPGDPPPARPPASTEAGLAADRDGPAGEAADRDGPAGGGWRVAGGPAVEAADRDRPGLTGPPRRRARPKAGLGPGQTASDEVARSGPKARRRARGPGGRRRATPAVLALAALALAALALWWSGPLAPPDPGAAQAAADGGRPDAVIAVAQQVPRLEGGAVTVDSAGDPFFTWTNPAPLPGDQYRWSPLAAPERARVTGEVQAAVARAEFGGGPVCIEVQLIRDGRTDASELRICEGT
jgi:hypothetical protein